ncbi:MAG: 50S ribosomal protein L11 methyltransferase [Ginsengibacter sp.]
MNRFFKIQIESPSKEESEMLIAQLSEINYYAFEEENNLLNAYVKEQDFAEEKLNKILPPQVSFSREIIEEVNWNSLWESQVKPVKIRDFVFIRPSFVAPVNDVKFDLIITPKMSFGTGHHDTTCLMIEMMETINFKEKTVVDFGTGTGILAILSEKCGASKVIAIDYDEWSIQNADENIIANDCNRIDLKQQQEISGIKKADIVLANINLNVIKKEADAIAGIIESEGLLLVSGFLEKDEREMKKTFEALDFVCIKTKKINEWVAVLIKKN